jgi:hypothetical protein
MGVDTRKRPPLPAPTESTVLPTSSEEVQTDLATDVSRHTDRTSYSIPEDGSPITLNTHRKSEKSLSRHGNQSQTSLLIEYFEGGKGPNVSSRPSVRVKVTPSGSSKKGKDQRDHIQITEASGGRKPSYTRRISIPPRNHSEGTIEADNNSVSSLAEESTLSGRPPPVEIEVMHKDQDSELSSTSLSRDTRYLAINPSELSSIPPDSMLDGGRTESLHPKRSRSRSLTRAALAAGAAAAGTAAVTGTLKAPRERSRSLSRERLTQKVIEKLGKEPHISSKNKHSRSRSVSKEQLSEGVGSPRRRSGKYHKIEDLPSEVSGLTESQVSGQSYRSDNSKYSVTNPKLLQAVEDSIRRLILPELNALKAQQEKRDLVEPNSKGEDSSFDAYKISTRGDGSIKKKRSKYSDKYENSASEASFEQGMSQETVVHDGESKQRRRSKESSKLRDAAIGAVVGGLTHAALKQHDSSSSVDRKERRRKRSKSHSRSQSAASIADTEEIFNKHDVPPMPMRSELTNSDVTRDSILSERTSTPSSERRRAEIRQVARLSPKQLFSPSGTPKSPSGLRHSQSYDDPEFYDEYSQHSIESYEGSPTKTKHHYAEAALAGAAGAGLLANQYGSHDAPAPGRYVHGRSLSPIQSVASYEERGEMSRHSSQRKPRQIASTSSLGKQLNHKASRSVTSLESVDYQPKKTRPERINLESPSEILVGHDIKNTENKDRDPINESWFEGDDQKEYEDSPYRDSYDSSRIPVGHLTQYTDDSMDAPYLDKVTAAQPLRSGAKGDPEWVHTPIAVESAVASLLEPSVLDGRSNMSVRSYQEESRVDSPGSDTKPFTQNGYYKGNISSPLRQQYTAEHDESEENARDMHEQFAEESPQQSPSVSIKERDSYVPAMTDTAVPDPNDPLPEIMDPDTRSEISTNPPDIQGPAAQWAYHQLTPPQSKGGHLATSNHSANESLKEAAQNMLRVAQGAGAAVAAAKYGHKVHDSIDTETDLGQELPPEERYQGGFNDEGYETNVPNRSPGGMTPDIRHKSQGLFPDTGFLGMGGVEDDDPFDSGNLKRLSGNSHGMAPLYDAATGEGKDRIQSKDIIALMDHVSYRLFRSASLTKCSSPSEMLSGMPGTQRFFLP